MAIESEIQAVLDSPDGSDWLKHCLRTALARDCVDAANDAQVLSELLDRLTASRLGVTLPGGAPSLGDANAPHGGSDNATCL